MDQNELFVKVSEGLTKLRNEMLKKNCIVSINELFDEYSKICPDDEKELMNYLARKDIVIWTSCE